MKNVLEADSIILSFDSNRILHNVYLKVCTGEVLGILGRNGCGKSCLMKIIYGALVSADQSIRINKQALYTSYRSPKDMMYLPQVPFIPNTLSLKRIFKDFNLDYEAFTFHFPEFKKYYNNKLKALSSGEQRIIEIYTILLSKTKFCLLDEPFSQVMPLHIETIKTLIIQEKQNKGIIITDHLYHHLIALSDDVCIINEGKTNYVTTLDEIKALGYINA